jgi:hypothetical protein
MSIVIGETYWSAGVYLGNGEPNGFTSPGVAVFVDDTTVVLLRNPESPYRSTTAYSPAEVFDTEAEAHGEVVRKLAALRDETASKFDSLICKHRGLQGVVSVG